MKKLIKKFGLLSAGCIILFGIVTYIDHVRITEKWMLSITNFSNTNTLIYIKYATSNNSNNKNEIAEDIIEGDRNIYFLETSHIKDNCGNNEITLNTRQGCAIESAARMNPTMKVYLFIFTSQSSDYSKMTKNIILQLTSYPNVKIRRIPFKTYIENSPIKNWWNSSKGPSTSHWYTSHVSDILRYLTLWKFGGIYLDLDVVIKSSLEHMENFAGAEDWSNVAAGVIGFSATGIGRQYAIECLSEVILHFRGDNWGYNGPGVITRTLKKICDTEKINEMTPNRCNGFKIFPPSVFYPISWNNWKLYFDITNKSDTMKMIQNALAIHVWNNLSKSTIIKVGSKVPYELIASEYCPRIYKNLTNTF